MTTRAPTSWNALTHAEPMPPEAPVTMTTGDGVAFLFIVVAGEWFARVSFPVREFSRSKDSRAGAFRPARCGSRLRWSYRVCVSQKPGTHLARGGYEMKCLSNHSA